MPEEIEILKSNCIAVWIKIRPRNVIFFSSFSFFFFHELFHESYNKTWNRHEIFKNDENIFVIKIFLCSNWHVV